MYQKDIQRFEAATDGAHPATAVALAQRILRVHPKDWYVRFERARALMRLGRLRDALKSANGLERLIPANLKHHLCNLRGHIFNKMHAYNSARKHYRAALRCRASSAGECIYVGAVLAKQGRFPEAAEYHEKATRCADGCIDEAWLNLGHVRRAQERLADAEHCYRQALARSPDYPEAQQGLDDILEARKDLGGFSMGELRERIKACYGTFPLTTIYSATRFLEREPTDAFVRYVLSQAFTSLARYRDAERESVLGMRQHPERKDFFLSQLGWNSSERGQLARALKYYKRAWLSRPSEAHPCIEMSDVYVRLDQHSEALRWLLRAVKLGQPDKNADAWIKLGYGHRAEERFKKAAECFRKALKIDWGLTDALTALEDIRGAAHFSK